MSYTADNDDFLIGDNSFECLDDNCAINCCICNNLISEKDNSLTFFQRNSNMYPSCFDLDLDDNVIVYLSKSSSNFRLICHVCVTEPAGATNTCVIKKRLAAIEHQLARMNDNSSNELSCLEPLTIHLLPLQEKPTSVATEISGGNSHSRLIYIPDEIADALEKEKRKCNLIIYNLPPLSVNDAVRLGALFEHITGEPT